MIACVLAAAANGVAYADDTKDVDAAIRAVIDGEQPWADSSTSSNKTPTQYSKLAGAYMLGPSGATVTDEEGLGAELHDIAPGNAPLGGIRWKLGALTVAVDGKRGFAWFQAPVTLALEFWWQGPDNPRATDSLRASGVLVKDSKGWHLVALALSRQLPDKVLFRGAKDTLATGDPTVDDSALAKRAAAWFGKGGLARGKTTGATVIASGTAPAEYATGKAAGKLVTAWDKLGMRVKSIEAKMFAGDAVGVVRAEAQLPVKKLGAPMALYAIAVTEEGTWRWVSLQFATELAKPPVPKQQ